MKEYNCPDCQVNEDSCSKCPRTKSHTVDILDNNIENLMKAADKYLSSIPKMCLDCDINPLNGGSGICNCTRYLRLL